MTVFIADISSYQDGLVPAELRPECVGVEIKATQGSTYSNPLYANWLAESKAAGLTTIPYHWIDGSSPAAQAANLAAHIVDPSLPVMLDFEESTLAQALAVADAMTAAKLRPKLLYLSRTRWKALGSPGLSVPLKARGLSLVNAEYPSGATGAPAALYPGDSAAGWTAYGGVIPALWQFTDRAAAAGQRIDMNAYRGTAAQFAALIGATEPATSPSKPSPAAPAAPKEDDVTTYFPVQVMADPTGNPNGAGVATWPAGAAHVFQLVADPGKWGDSSGAFELAFILTSGPDVTTTQVAKGSESSISIQLADVPGLNKANCRGVTITRPDGKKWPWGGGAA